MSCSRTPDSQPGDRVEHARQRAARERVVAVRLPARDEVVPLVELGEETGDLRRVVLEVAVDRHDDLALDLAEARVQRGGLADVASQPHHPDVGDARVETHQRRRRAVARAVVDEHDLPRLAAAGERTRELVVEGLDGELLVTDGDDDRDHAAERTPCVPSAPWPISCPSRTPSRSCCRAFGRFRARPWPSKPRPAGCWPRTRSLRSTCRASRARRWTALRSGRPTPRARSRSSPVSQPAGPCRGRSSAVRRWESRRAESSRMAPTRSCPSSSSRSATGRSSCPIRVDPGANVRPLGGDVHAGTPVLHAGTTLTPSRLAGLAAAGVAHPRCAVRPRVAIVTTGTELRAPGEPLADGEIYESNGLMLEALLASAGALVEPRETVVGRRGVPPVGARPRPRGRRPRHLRRRLARPARPRPRHARGARRGGALLGSRDAAGQAALVRRAGRHARLRPPGKPGLVPRRGVALRPPRAPRPAGGSRPRRRGSTPGCWRRRRAGTRSATTSSGRRSRRPTRARCSGRSRARSRT